MVGSLTSKYNICYVQHIDGSIPQTFWEPQQLIHHRLFELPQVIQYIQKKPIQVTTITIHLSASTIAQNETDYFTLHE